MCLDSGPYFYAFKHPGEIDEIIIYFERPVTFLKDEKSIFQFSIGSMPVSIKDLKSVENIGIQFSFRYRYSPLIFKLDLPNSILNAEVLT